MKILVNASNLKKGGGLQVADSICCMLNMHTGHNFVVVLSDKLNKTAEIVARYDNVRLYQYNSTNKLSVLLSGRDSFLDNLVKIHDVDVVVSVFGPIAWIPTVPHLCGFARPHIVLGDSPYFTRMSLLSRLKHIILNKVLTYFFARSSTVLYTENQMISERLKKKIRNREIVTITNYYNQIFDNPGTWAEFSLPEWEGVTICCVSAYYPHKNLGISLEVAKKLEELLKEKDFRFVFTVDENDFPPIAPDLREHFVFLGRMDVRTLPSLYLQSDIMFQPSLLECFSASYPEAMRMNVPIVTTDVDFAKGLCGDAAMYYSAVDASDAAQKIYEIITNRVLCETLIQNGKRQLETYDTYEERVNKILSVALSMIK